MKPYTVVLNKLVNKRPIFNTESIRVATDDPKKIIDHFECEGDFVSFIFEGHPRLEGEIGPIKDIQEII